MYELHRDWSEWFSSHRKLRKRNKLLEEGGERVLTSASEYWDSPYDIATVWAVCMGVGKHSSIFASFACEHVVFRKVMFYFRNYFRFTFKCSVTVCVGLQKTLKLCLEPYTCVQRGKVDGFNAMNFTLLLIKCSRFHNTKCVERFVNCANF